MKKHFLESWEANTPEAEELINYPAPKGTGFVI